MLGQAASAIAGDVIPGGRIMMRAVKLCVRVLELISGRVNDIQS